jgi:hypothetical protein
VKKPFIMPYTIQKGIRSLTSRETTPIKEKLVLERQ